MPDGRFRDSTAYSTHKSTMANRRRLAAMDPVRRVQLRHRTVEYQAIWQLLDRMSRKDDYRYATRETQRAMLQDAAGHLLEKRRCEGKVMCNIDAGAMIERHLNKEANARSRQSATESSLATINSQGVDCGIAPGGPSTPPDTPLGDEDMGLKEELTNWLRNSDEDNGENSNTSNGSEHDTFLTGYGLGNGAVKQDPFDEGIAHADLATRFCQLEAKVDNLVRSLQLYFPPSSLSNSALASLPGGMGQGYFPFSGGAIVGGGVGIGFPSAPPMNMFNFAPHLSGAMNGGMHHAKNDASNITNDKDEQDQSEAAAAAPAAPGWPFAPPGEVPMFKYQPPIVESQPSEDDE